jgi:hypothetical protein
MYLSRRRACQADRGASQKLTGQGDWGEAR